MGVGGAGLEAGSAEEFVRGSAGCAERWGVLAGGTFGVACKALF